MTDWITMGLVSLNLVGLLLTLWQSLKIRLALSKVEHAMNNVRGQMRTIAELLAR